MSEARTLVSQSAYARHRGVSRQAVAKAIGDGRLVDAVIRAEGQRLQIHVEAADLEWDRKTDPTQQREGHRLPAEDPGQTKLFETGEPERPAPAPPDTTGEQTTREVLNDARARRETVAAELAELELLERRGRSIDPAEVEREWFRIGRLVRDGLAEIGTRLSSRFGSMTDPREIKRLLDDAHARVLTELADEHGRDDASD